MHSDFFEMALNSHSTVKKRKLKIIDDSLYASFIIRDIIENYSQQILIQRKSLGPKTNIYEIHIVCFKRKCLKYSCNFSL